MNSSLKSSCPKCGAELDDASWKGLDFKACPNCGGIFLKQEKIPFSELLESDTLSRKREDAELLDSKEANCPNCKVLMKKQKHRRRFTLDICSSCNGVWFDQGELAQFYGFAAKKNSIPHEIVLRFYCEFCVKEIDSRKVLKNRQESTKCPVCQTPLSLVAEPPIENVKLSKKDILSLCLFLLGEGILYLITAHLFQNALSATFFTLTLGAVGFLIIIRAVVYGKFAWRTRERDIR